MKKFLQIAFTVGLILSAVGVLVHVPSSRPHYFVMPVQAQNSGQFGASTVSKSFVTATTTGLLTVNQPTNPSFPTLLPNIGASAHYLFFCAVNTTQLQLVIEGSYDNVSWVPISATTTSNSLVASSHCASGNAGLLQGAGYYPNVRVSLAGLAGSSPSVSAWYSGTAGPVTVFPPALQDGQGSLVGGAGVSPTVCSRSSFFQVANGATQSLASSTTATYICDVTVTFGGAVTASGTVNFFTATNIACNAGLQQLSNLFAGLGNPINMGSNLGSLYQIPPGQFFCVTTTGVGTNTLISYSLSQY